MRKQKKIVRKIKVKKKRQPVSSPQRIIKLNSGTRCRKKPESRQLKVERGIPINIKDGYVLLEKSDIGTDIKPEWKKMVANNANTVIRHIMNLEKLSRPEAIKLLGEKNLFAAKSFIRNKTGKENNYMLRYSFRDKEIYWKME